MARALFDELMNHGRRLFKKEEPPANTAIRSCPVRDLLRQPSNVQIGCSLRSELNWTWVGGMSSPPLNKSCTRAELFKRPVRSSASSRWPQALVQNRKQAPRQEFRLQPGHPVAARDSPLRMNMTVVPSATSGPPSSSVWPARPRQFFHATCRVRPDSAHFAACRAAPV